jgi:hypothetical protein
MEKTGDENKLERAHYLRYTIMNMVVFLIGVLNGADRAAEILADAAQTMIPERAADYIKEHSNANSEQA